MRSRLVLDEPAVLETAVADEVRRLKGGEPLAPVTILAEGPCT